MQVLDSTLTGKIHLLQLLVPVIPLNSGLVLLKISSAMSMEYLAYSPEMEIDCVSRYT